ncbi:MAG: ABC transporter permease [Hespellia sp.]|nr:ABC transporter permease [Hespellia sp.]
MIRVKNRKAITNLSRKSLKASRARNLVAIAAIALTTLLFTALFTIALSINTGFQESNFRQCGGWNHGTFKYLTEKQFNELKTDSTIKEWGVRRFLGMPTDAPFNKDHVEIGYSDEVQAHWMYCDPIKGRLPKEGTNETATDTHVLELLGVKPELGATFTVTFMVDNKKTTQTFTLCGWWEYDEAIVANHILIPESRVNAVLKELNVNPETAVDNAGSWGLDVMFSNAWKIEQKMDDILARHGYQSESKSEGDNYIATGVNWGYTSSQLSDSTDIGTVVGIVGMLVLITFTGYLIIYNVFRISVVNDIRFYGMLKTIGTTPRQVRRMIRQQALTLSLIGIPVGLILGWGIGSILVPVVVGSLDGIIETVSASPFIFVFAALFSLVTVLLSCSRPGRLAGRVSPIEALRYTEKTKGKKGNKGKKRTAGVSLPRMAWANLGRSHSKTVITVLSLSLAVLLMTLTVTFTNGFDMDKYLTKFVATDFVFSDASYFQTGIRYKEPVAPADVDAVSSRTEIADGGRIYGGTGMINEAVTEDYFRMQNKDWYDAKGLDQLVESADKTADGHILTGVNLYGMEAFALDQLKVIEGDLSKLHEAGSNAIAAVYEDDDYDNLIPESHWAKLGDSVTLTYVDEVDYVDTETGESVDPSSEEDYVQKILSSHEVTYTVTALVLVPPAMSYRYYGSDPFVLNDQTYIRDTGRNQIMSYVFNTKDDAANASMEKYMTDYTQNQNPDCDYESKATYAAQFEGFRSMFLLLGGALSFIVGLVGILNFFNAILTGILTRRREFAMLQSIGMTGKQLKTMLICEGLLYALGAILFSMVLTVVTGRMLSKTLESMFWFYRYQLTITPILIVLPVFVLLGVLLPLLSYQSVAKKTVVERLRDTEG